MARMNILLFNIPSSDGNNPKENRFVQVSLFIKLKRFPSLFWELTREFVVRHRIYCVQVVGSRHSGREIPPLKPYGYLKFIFSHSRKGGPNAIWDFSRKLILGDPQASPMVVIRSISFSGKSLLKTVSTCKQILGTTGSAKYFGNHRRIWFLGKDHYTYSVGENFAKIFRNVPEKLFPNTPREHHHLGYWKYQNSSRRARGFCTVSAGRARQFSSVVENPRTTYFVEDTRDCEGPEHRKFEGDITPKGLLLSSEIPVTQTSSWGSQRLGWEEKQYQQS
nr:hypothetical protein Iba_chr12fCG11050 [Ipomoea batatas]